MIYTDPRSPDTTITKNETMDDPTNNFNPRQPDLRWFPVESLKELKGAALVIHGLNLAPCKMESIIGLLNSENISAALLPLYGHGDNFDKQKGDSDQSARLSSFKEVSYTLWSQELLSAYQSVRAFADKHEVPVFLIGYSLGALMGCCLLLSQPVISYEKMVLFAPAIRIRWLNGSFIKLLSRFPGLVIPSRSPAGYRSNRGTPVAGYLSLFEAIRTFNRDFNTHLNIPTLLFMDPADELISYKNIKTLIEEKDINLWQIQKIENNRNQTNKGFRHLIIDEPAVGKNNWEIINNRLITFLQTY